ncbi:Protein of unknown function [Bacillus toyonensis]|nr:Protein of unknown function [Bacillus toyonensis]
MELSSDEQYTSDD